MVYLAKQALNLVKNDSCLPQLQFNLHINRSALVTCLNYYNQSSQKQIVKITNVDIHKKQIVKITNVDIYNVQVT